MNKIYLLLICLFFELPLLGQVDLLSPSETGRPLIRNYSPKEYRAGAQNFVVAQDPRGIIYIGNNSALALEFDGVRWRQIELPGLVFSRSLACDESGRVFIGGLKDFGFLAPDSTNQLNFQSLLPYVKLEDREFTRIFSIHATPRGVYFRSFEYLFRWKNQSLKAWKAQTIFKNDFWVNGSLYVYQEGIGLMKMAGDSLQTISGGENFASREVRAMLPFSSGQKGMLMGISGEGLFFYNDEQLQPLKGGASEFARRNTIYCSAVLDDSTFAIGSSNGAVVFDHHGEIIQLLDKAAGLAANRVFSIMPDREGGIWLALLNGIARVNSIRPAFTIFDERNGLGGAVRQSQARHNGILYVRTRSGIYYLDPQQGRFSAVPGAASRADIFQSGQSLYAIGKSLWKIDGNRGRLVTHLQDEAESAWPSIRDTNLVYINLQRRPGFKMIRREKNHWVEGQKIEGIDLYISSVTEGADGSVWLGSQSGDIFRLNFSADNNRYDIRRFGKEHGLPTGRVDVFQTSLYPLFSTPNGIFRFTEASQRFIPDTTFGRLLADGSRTVLNLKEDRRGNVWMSVSEGATYNLNVSRYRDGTFFHEEIPFVRVPSTGIWNVFPEDNGIVWFGGEDGYLRYDDKNRKNYAVDFQSLIRRVIVNDDSVIYGGASPGGMSPFLPYKNNALRFEFAATSFELPSANRFQYFLEGFDDGWSAWGDETQKDYTNIPEGRYTFRVRAQNVYEHFSSEGRFSFNILPPWYRTWWAYMLYGILVLAIFLSIRRYELSRQRFKHQAEMQHIEAEKFKELDRLKSRFFANISHEFRTPLTLILGQIESLLPNLKKGSNIQKAKMALRNAGQLQRLINQLLDLSKFDAHRMTLNASEQNIVPLLRHLTGAFESLAAQKNLILVFESQQENIPVWFEQDKIEKVMYNLLSNAFKFTEEGGRIQVAVSVVSDFGMRIADLKEKNKEHRSEVIAQEEKRLANDKRSETSGSKKSEIGEVRIAVRDSGIGISRERLPHIFDRFYQVDSSTTREYEGTGIGLALTKELVQIHGGSISVESEEGFGTTFTVRLPLGMVHLKQEQISETSISDLKEKGNAQNAERGTLSENMLVSNLQPAISNIETSAIRNQKTEIVLIVEDNQDMRAYIRETLERHYRIIEAPNGEAGFQKAREEIPDLIITDVMMPKMDGYEMTRELRREQVTSHIPIIMLTAKAAESDKFEGLETGVDAFLVKPFSTKELHIRVRKLIELRQKLREQTGMKAVLQPAEIDVSSLDQQFLQRVQDTIEAHIENEAFSVDTLASGIGVSKRQLQRKLKALTDLSPNQCIRSMRLQRARQLLEQGAGNVTEAAFSVGYSDVTAFSKAFREEFGQPPSAFIRR